MPHNMNEMSAYEFFAGPRSGEHPKWTHEFSKIGPLIEWDGHMGPVTMTYDAPLKRYLMCVTHGPWPAPGANDTYILISRYITGPWKLAAYLNKFGEEAYFINIPSKFIERDGYTLWLCYSEPEPATRPVNLPGSRYALCLREIRLIPREQTHPIGQDSIKRGPDKTVRSTPISGYANFGHY